MKIYIVLTVIIAACQAQDWYRSNSKSYSKVGPYNYDNRYEYPYESGKYLEEYPKEMKKENKKEEYLEQSQKDFKNDNFKKEEKKNEKTNPFSPKYEEFAASKEFNELGLLGGFGLGYDRRTKDSAGLQEPLTPQLLKTVGVGYWGRITQQNFPEKY